MLRGFDINGLENESGKSTTYTDRIKHVLILRYNVLHTRPPSFVPARIPFSSVSSFTTQFTLSCDRLIHPYQREFNGETRCADRGYVGWPARLRRRTGGHLVAGRGRFAIAGQWQVRSPWFPPSPDLLENL